MLSMLRRCLTTGQLYEEDRAFAARESDAVMRDPS